MKRTLFVLVAASALASSAAFAGMTNAQSGDPSASVRAVPVQYYGQPQERSYGQYQERSDSRIAEVREREARINGWIERGLNDGRLRPWQARRFQRELGDIHARERAMEADGRLNGREFAELNRDLDRLVEEVRNQTRYEERRY